MTRQAFNAMIDQEVQRLAEQADLMQAMRDWIADCQWGDLDAEQVDELSDAQVIAGIAKHYEGGIDQFEADGIPA